MGLGALLVPRRVEEPGIEDHRVAEMTPSERALSDLSGLKRGMLSVMASQTIASYWLPQRLVAFRAKHPHVAVKALIGNTAEVAKAVADGKVEIEYKNLILHADHVQYNSKTYLAVARGNVQLEIAETSNDLGYAIRVMLEIA